MKKPEITIEEFGAFGPDGLEMKIVRGEEIIATFLFKKEGEGKIITAMLKALIEAHELVLHQRIFEDDENMKRVLEYKKEVIESALRKAGYEL